MLFHFYKIYQINGIIRYLTLFLYSMYPSNSFSNNFSSFFILNIIRIGYTKKIKNDAKDPKTIGIDKNKIIVALYIGCLTIPYNPVSTTF